MMREILLLCRLEGGRFLGLNVFRHTRDVREKRRWWLLCSAFVILGVNLFIYVGGLVYGLVTLGLGEIAPAYLAMVVSLLLFILGLFSAGTRLFSPVGLDTLCAMPLRPAAIALARLLCLYLGDLALTVLALLPGVIVYAVMLKPSFGFWPALLLGIPALPVLPLIAASAIGTAVTAIAVRMRRKSVAQTLLMLIIVVGILIGSFALVPLSESVTPDQLATLAGTVGEMLAHVYPPAGWFGAAVTAGELPALLLLLGVSVAAAGAMALILTRIFLAVTRRMRVQTATHDFRIGAMASRALLPTLYLRELRRYFASSIYVTNTILAPVMAVILSAAVLAVGLDPIREALPLPLDPAGFLPFLLAATLSLMPTTAVSVSMEGQGIRALKTMPLPGKAWIDAKLLLHLGFCLPGWLISAALVAIATRPRGLALLWLALIPAAVTVFSSVAALAIDLRLHRFDWTDETAVVKQSASAMLGGFAGPLVAIVGGAAAVLLPTDAACAIFCGAITVAAWGLYRHCTRIELSRL